MRQEGDNKRIGGKVRDLALGRLPNVALDNNLPAKYTKRANRYLGYQSKRLEKFREEGNLLAAFLVGCLIAKNSKSYQVLLFHKVKNDGYGNLSRQESGNLALKVINHMRSGNLRTYITRFYIEKKNGKLRPIGAPNVEGKAMSVFMANMYTYLLEEERSKTCSNHAYRPKRGIHTALREIVENGSSANLGDKKPILYEFDFKSYFNRVTWETIYTTLLKFLGDGPADLALAHINSVRYRGKTLESEKELEIVGEKSKKPIIVRRGIPQGLPVSPLLATICNELKGTPKGLTMYADDGVGIGTDLSQIEKWLKYGKFSGLEPEPSKTGIIQDGVVKFLGFELDFNTYTISHPEQGSIPMGCSEKELKNFVTKAPYSGEKKRGEGDMRDLCAAEYHTRSIFLTSPLLWLLTCFFGLFKLEYKGLKYIPGKGIYDYMKTSSRCMDTLLGELLRVANRKELRTIKPLRLPVWVDRYYDKPLSKHGYFEGNETRKNKNDHDMLPRPSHSTFTFG